MLNYSHLIAFFLAATLGSQAYAVDRACNDPDYQRARLAEFQSAGDDLGVLVQAVLVDLVDSAAAYRVVTIDCSEEIWSTSGEPDALDLKLALAGNDGAGVLNVALRATYRLPGEDRRSFNVQMIELTSATLDLEQTPGPFEWVRQASTPDTAALVLTAVKEGHSPLVRAVAAKLDAFVQEAKRIDDADGTAFFELSGLRPLPQQFHALDFSLAARQAKGGSIEPYDLKIAHGYHGPAR